MKKQLFFLLLCSILNNISFAQQQKKHLISLGEVDSLYSNVLKENREIYIQLPSNYDLDKAQNYPVLYVIDGEFLLPTITMAHESYYGGFIPEMIIVGIANLPNRNRDLTPTKVETLFGRPATSETGKADQFRKFLSEELISYIDKKYRTTDYKTLVGHSYGGLFTIHTLLQQSDLFDNYVAIDPSLQWDEQVLLKEAANQLKSQNFENIGLYMSLGSQLDMQDPSVTIENVMDNESPMTVFPRSNIAFREMIKEHSNLKNFEWEYFSKDLHGTIVYPSIRNAFLSIFSWYQMENTYALNNPATTTAQLQEIIDNRANKLARHFGYKVPPYPQDLMNAQGYMNMDMKQMDKAKLYFESNIKYYPESANCYDSMADFYVRSNDYKEAYELVKKANKIHPTPYYKERMEEFSKKIK